MAFALETTPGRLPGQLPGARASMPLPRSLRGRIAKSIGRRESSTVGSKSMFSSHNNGYVL